MAGTGEALYWVEEAVKIRTEQGSFWRVTFETEGAGERIMVRVTPARLEALTFAAPYSEVEIEALRDVAPPAAE